VVRDSISPIEWAQLSEHKGCGHTTKKKQLIVLSRLRKYEMIAKTEIEAMPLHYNIETDGLYPEGIEKGIEKTLAEFTLKLWKMQEFPIAKIAMIVGIPQDSVLMFIGA
jgi:hypothetical protein